LSGGGVGTKDAEGFKTINIEPYSRLGGNEQEVNLVWAEVSWGSQKRQLKQKKPKKMRERHSDNTKSDGTLIVGKGLYQPADHN